MSFFKVRLMLCKKSLDRRQTAGAPIPALSPMSCTTSSNCLTSLCLSVYPRSAEYSSPYLIAPTHRMA